MTVEIKKLDADRWQDYRALRLEALKSEPLAFSSSYIEEEKSSEAFWRGSIHNVLFALADNEPVGMAGIFRNPRIKTSHVCEIFGMYVRRQYRGQGIGNRLITGILEEIQNLKGISKIKIGVNPTQKAAKHLYEKYGFKAAAHFKKEMCVDGKFYDEVFLEKYL